MCTQLHGDADLQNHAHVLLHKNDKKTACEVTRFRLETTHKFRTPDPWC